MSENFLIQLSVIVLFLPLLGFIVTVWLGKKIPKIFFFEVFVLFAGLVLSAILLFGKLTYFSDSRIVSKADAVRDAEVKAYQTSLKQADLLWGALLKNEGLLRIARTPLILSLVTLVHKNRTTDLPKGRASLYRECLEILLDLWDAKDKGLTIADAPSLNDKLFVLKTIGYCFVENGLLEMDSEGLESLVTPLLPSLTKSISASSLIKQIYERSGVLVEQAVGK